MTQRKVQILLPKRGLEGDDYAPINRMITFSFALVQSGQATWDDIPRIARAFTDLTQYAGQVANGGHMQWLQNRRWNQSEVRACRDGLAMLQPNSFQDIFADLYALMETDPDMGERFRQGDLPLLTPNERRRVEETLDQLDKRFFSHRGPRALIKLMSHAVLKHPSAAFVDDWDERVAQIKNSHSHDARG